MSEKRKKSPQVANWLIRKLLSEEEYLEKSGDMDEVYYGIMKYTGFVSARLWYWSQVILALPVFISNTFYWSSAMFKNYLKVAFRNIRNHKGYSLINLTGLIIGLTSCILILSYVLYELSYDRYHEKSERIFRLGVKGNIGQRQMSVPITNYAAAPSLAREYPEVINSVKFFPMAWTGRIFVKYGEKQFYEENIYYAENSVFDIFTFPMIKGNPKTALETANTIVITEDVARKYFGDEEPVGKFLKFNNQTDFVVTGVIENVPKNSHLTFDMLYSFKTIYSAGMESEVDFRYYSYILVQENCNYKDLDKKISSFQDEPLKSILAATGGKVNYFIEPVTRLHLYSQMSYNPPGAGNVKYVYIFSVIAVFVLLIACINFMNLSSARSTIRSREVGIRKVLGSDRKKLVNQFLGESLLYSFISLVMALILVKFLLPFFNTLAGSSLTLHNSDLRWLIPGFIMTVFFVGIIAGSYPAFILSSFQPVMVLKGSSKGTLHSRFRSILVVAQFTISIILIIGTYIISNQVKFMKNKDLGFNKEQIVVLPVSNKTTQLSVKSLKEEIRSIKGVINAASSVDVPGKPLNSRTFFVPEGFSEEEAQLMIHLQIDEDYFSTMGIELKEGRNFSGEISSDTLESIIINETAAKKFGWDNPLGKTIQSNIGSGQTGIVIGVIKDFHLESLQQEIEPYLIRYVPGYLSYISVRINTESIQETMELLKKKWMEFFPGTPNDYFFLDESFDSLYRTEERLNTIFSYFTLFTIFIACLGLFGLASFTAERRIKEIGIRKVLGASTTGIIFQLSKEFLRWVAVANIIAWPIAYYFMNRWLHNFAFRTSIGIDVFILSGMIATVSALLTISYQVARTSLSNPVKALRYE